MSSGGVTWESSRDNRHWMRLDDTTRMVNRRMRRAVVARCACGWESAPETIHVLAVEAGCEHSTEATAADRRAGRQPTI